jgi:hypothetical protein
VVCLGAVKSCAIAAPAASTVIVAMSNVLTLSRYHIRPSQATTVGILA